MHCLDWGDPSAPPLLFLHGGGQTCRTWDVICHVLADRYRCIALDQRGHGDSEWSYEGDYRAASHATDIAGSLDALGIERAIVVGMSMGCINALEFTLGSPERVKGLVAVDAGPWVEMSGAKPIIGFMDEVGKLDRLEDFLAVALRFNPRRDDRLLRSSLLHNLRRRPDGRMMWKTDLRERLDRISDMEATMIRLRERVGEIECPTLVVRGGESRVLTDDNAARFANALKKGDWVRIDGAGHTVQGDQPRALVGAIEGLIARMDSNGAGGMAD
jgi:pimeloyl-ACP methyl ester carboxylesterase